MDWIQQWQSKLNKQNGVAPLVRTGGSRHTGLAALPYRNIHLSQEEVADIPVFDPVSAHIELIEENNVLRKVIADFHASMESATRTHE